MQQTGLNRNTVDQFYTSEAVARQCIADIVLHCAEAPNYHWFEPAAGNGAFLFNVPAGVTATGIDIEPGDPNITKADFLTHDIANIAGNISDIIIFGNPPFGRQSSLAKRFIKRACKSANVIAFILPRSFVKPSQQAAFDPLFHLIHTVELDKNSFIVNGAEYDVPTVFQIWERRALPRVVEAPIEPIGFAYCKAINKADIIVRRVGALAGRCYVRGEARCAQSHYYITIDADINTTLLIQKMNAHEYVHNTVGPRSLSKSEVNTVLNAALSECLAIAHST